MPRTRDLVTYPNQQFLALVRRVLDTREPFLVACLPSAAASMRGSLHAWRRACEVQQGKAEAMGIPVGELRRVAFRITPEGLQAFLAETLQTPSLIDAALGGTALIVTEAELALERLRRELLAPQENKNGG